MTPDERRQKLQAIIDQHDAIARELRESGEAFRASRTHIDTTTTAIDALAVHLAETSAATRALAARIADMGTAIEKATTAMIAANHAAMALFNEE